MVGDSRNGAGNAAAVFAGGREIASYGIDYLGSSGDGTTTDRSGGGGGGSSGGGNGGGSGSSGGSDGYYRDVGYATRVENNSDVQPRFEESAAATRGGEAAGRRADCVERCDHEQNGFWQPSVASAKRKRPYCCEDDDNDDSPEGPESLLSFGRTTLEAASASGLTCTRGDVPQASFYYESLAGLSDPSCRDHRATTCLTGDWSTSRRPPVDLTESGNATAAEELGGGQQDRQSFGDPHNQNHPRNQLHPLNLPQQGPGGLSAYPHAHSVAEGACASAPGAAERASAGGTAREPAAAGDTGGTGGWRGGSAEGNRIVVGAPALLASATTGGDRLGGVMRGGVTAPPHQTAHAQTQECAAAAETPHTSQEQERARELLHRQSPAGGTSGQARIAADAAGGACAGAAMSTGAATAAGAGGSLGPPSILPPSMVALPATALLPLPWQHLLPHRPSTHVLLPLPSPPHLPALPQPLPQLLTSQPRLLISQPQLSSQPQLLIAQPQSSSHPPLQSPLPFQSSPLVPAPWPATAPPPTHGLGFSTVAPHPLPANSSALAVTAAAAGGGRHGVGGGKGEGMVGDEGYDQGQGHDGDGDATNQRKQRSSLVASPVWLPLVSSPFCLTPCLFPVGRMHSNRQSAKRSRLRRQQLLEKLEMDAAKLRVEHSALCRREAEATERAAELHRQQVRLQQERDAVLARMKERGSEMEDIWKEAFPVGTEWDQYDKVYDIEWDFSNLDEAFDEGGPLHDKRVYLFGCTEPQLVHWKGKDKVVHVPAVVAVLSPFAPSDKLGIKSVQMETEMIVPMREMKMDWIPFIPDTTGRGSDLRRHRSNIFTLKCIQRRAGLRQMKHERVKKFEYCLPYIFLPHMQEEQEVDTVVSIMYPFEGDNPPPPLLAEYDWEMDEYEEFTDNLVKDESLPEAEKAKFIEYVKKEVKEAKLKAKKEREERKKAIEDMGEERLEALKNLRFLKFYPKQSDDTPDISEFKAHYINRYYGKAHEEGGQPHVGGVLSEGVEAGGRDAAH
ncbi:unnamed protein product [Closterium sp. Naga37s-1]|nr:unnamed protein product [Closterium sp. Naga37s-1]